MKIGIGKRYWYPGKFIFIYMEISNFFENPSTHEMKRLFSRRTIKQWHGGFEERDCSRYPIIARAWRVYRSINRLCCVARILSRSDDVINDYLSASYRALMTSSGAPRQRDTMKTSSKIQQSSRVFFLWKQYSSNVFKNREERERKKAGIIR